MRARIQKSMVLVLSMTLLISYLVLTVVMYNHNLSILEREVRQDAKYIGAAINTFGTGYFEHMVDVDEGTRVTWIDADGTVLYDSQSKAAALENHKSRPEVQSALSSGSGVDIRLSGTLGRKMYYYALLLDDGTVLRVAKMMDGLMRTATSILPVMSILTVSMLLFAWLMSKWQTARLIRPLNGLDIEHPLDNDIYEELSPLLQAINRQNKEKDAIADMRKEFSANVSHELKTPLTSILGYAEIMKNGMVKPEDIPNFSERIYKEARRLIMLVEDIIKLSKLDEGSVDSEKEEVDLYALCREIVSRLAPQANAKKVSVAVSGEPVIYRGVRQVLDEMIYNICENAIKYNVVEGRISVWVGNTLQGPKVSVADSGIGIPREHHDRIFERFYRVDKSHSKESGGTGLGLSIVKHGALLHGAKVTVDSEAGRGTRMDIQF
ncbi:sensor histidine kinase [Faecalicatena contorta]|uniref:histidine kinase n=1 Tax=Faecalicatena contorta TaxID=39482 RepID=A0A315ZX53_9FIRM|nr:ATP-binding protein [Faecalicatena contorta]PWJ49812.1 two-component system phosphate regulon sensor histidine kinase PhoR [Faecalicatena contorta]SUQ14530.1 two-component system, OmpR family, phosphate regulon sensor histidine kinase PhoR [Faecalicatena contorta]